MDKNENKEKLIAKRLSHGDTIGVISPSFLIEDDDFVKLNASITFFKEKGFKIKEGKYLKEKWLGSAGTPEQRAEDLNTMFADSEVDAIICGCGGGTCNTMLPFIDFDIISKNPKIFMGYSDISVLNQAIYDKTGLITFNGPLMWDFGIEKFRKENYAAFVSRLMNAEKTLRADDSLKCVRSGSASGTFMGTNIKCTMHMMGTDFFPDYSGAILGVEAYYIDVFDCAVRFSQLQQNGLFDKIKGAVVGYVHGLQTPEALAKGTPQMEDILLEITKDYDFPILKCSLFGHEMANEIIPIGADVCLDADNCRFQIVEDFLR